MVTATGIFLGFLLNFTGQWIREARPVQRLRDVVVAVGISISLCLLLLVLFRILRMNAHTDPEKFYRTTLLLFLIGISIPFVAFLVTIIEKVILSFQ